MTANHSTQHEFSNHPGPRERHLQRKLNNPLFSDARSIMQQDIHAVQLEDFQALHKFMLQFDALVQESVALDINVEHDVILLLKAQLEHLYAVCTGIQGQSAAIKTAIKKLITAISATLRDASKNDADALEKLNTDEEYTTLHLQLCEQLIVSDILNQDKIIREDELVPSLLNESEAGLQAALALFPPERVTVMIEAGMALLKKIETQGHNLPNAWQRIAQMKHWLQGE